MDREIPIPSALLAHYWANEASPAERAEAEAWLARHPDMGEILRQAWEASAAPSVSHVDVDAAWTRFAQATSSARLAVRHDRSTGKPIAHRWIAAACGVAAAGLGIWYAAAWSHRVERGTSDAHIAGVVEHTYRTAVGQRASIALRDGTRVTLAPSTTLAVYAPASDGTRLVALVGEALFDVMHTARVPFVVRTANVTTRVLGTTFDVRRYPEDMHVRVAVTSGRVVVSATTARRPSVTLAAGNVGEITDSTAISSAMADTAPYVEWTTGRLAFHEAPLPELLATVGRWYGYQFRLADSTMAAQNITATLDYGSTAKVFATLKLLLDADLDIDGHVVTIRPRHTTAGVPRHMPLRMPRAQPTLNEVGR